MIGNRIKMLREEMGLKQEDLAKEISVSPSTIGMYEINKREPNNDITIRLSNFFNVSIDYLLGKTDIKNIEQSDTSTSSRIREVSKKMSKMSEEDMKKLESLIDIWFNDENK